MDPPSDLIDHFKLNAHHTNGITTETSDSYSSDPVRGLRKVKVNRKWHRGRSLGHGAFGAVWLEENADASNDPKLKTARAVKEVSKPFMRAVQIDYNRELLALAKLSKFSHAFVEFHGWFESEHLVFLVMEYVPCGDLVGFIQNGVGEGEAKVIAGQLLEGLAVMHRYCFTHRDLKPSNIFVKSPPPHWWVKIGDFGITKRVSNEQTALRTELGSRSFQAPEVAGIASDYGDYSNSVDIWSLGCVIHKVLTGAVPFDGITALESYCSSRTEFPEKPLKDRGVSDDGVKFLTRLLAVKPESRPTAVVAIEDQWLHVEEVDRDDFDGTGFENNSQSSQTSRNDANKKESTPNKVMKSLEGLGAQGEDRPSLVESPTPSSAKGAHLPSQIANESSDGPASDDIDKSQISSDASHDADQTVTRDSFGSSSARLPSSPQDEESKTSSNSTERQIALKYLSAIKRGIDSPVEDRHAQLSLILKQEGLEEFVKSEPDKAMSIELFKAAQQLAPKPPDPSRIPSPDLQNLISRYCEDPLSLDSHEWASVLAWTAGWTLNDESGAQRATSAYLNRDNPIQLAPKSARPTPSLERLISRYCEDPLSVTAQGQSRVIAWTGWPEHADTGVQRVTSTESTRDNPIQIVHRSARPTPSLERLISMYCDDPYSISRQERRRVTAYTGWPKTRDEQIFAPSNKAGEKAQVKFTADEWAQQMRDVDEQTYGHWNHADENTQPKFTADEWKQQMRDVDEQTFGHWNHAGEKAQARFSVHEWGQRLNPLDDHSEQKSLKNSRLPTPSLENMIKIYCDTPQFLPLSDRQRVLEWTGWHHTKDFFPKVSISEPIARSTLSNEFSYITSEDLTQPPRTNPPSRFTSDDTTTIRRHRSPSDFSYITSNDLARPGLSSAPSPYISISQRGVNPSAPQDYDPRIRGQVTHDFSAPRPRRHKDYGESPPVSVKVKVPIDGRQVTLRRLTEEEAAADREARRRNREQRRRSESPSDEPLPSIRPIGTAIRRSKSPRRDLDWRESEKESEEYYPDDPYHPVNTYNPYYPDKDYYPADTETPEAKSYSPRKQPYSGLPDSWRAKLGL